METGCWINSDVENISELFKPPVLWCIGCFRCLPTYGTSWYLGSDEETRTFSDLVHGENIRLIFKGQRQRNATFFSKPSAPFLQAAFTFHGSQAASTFSFTGDEGAAAVSISCKWLAGFQLEAKTQVCKVNGTVLHTLTEVKGLLQATP